MVKILKFWETIEKCLDIDLKIIFSKHYVPMPKTTHYKSYNWKHTLHTLSSAKKNTFIFCHVIWSKGESPSTVGSTINKCQKLCTLGEKIDNIFQNSQKWPSNRQKSKFSKKNVLLFLCHNEPTCQKLCL